MAYIEVKNEICWKGITDFGELTPAPDGAGWQFASYTTSPAPVRATYREAYQDMTDYAEGVRAA